jgi:hypothetical protein
MVMMDESTGRWDGMDKRERTFKEQRSKATAFSDGYLLSS